MFPLNLYARVRVLCAQLHARPRVQRAPGLPCALCFREGQRSTQTSGATRREIAKLYPPSLRAQRSNPFRRLRRNGWLRRFAPRNDRYWQSTRARHEDLLQSKRALLRRGANRRAAGWAVQEGEVTFTVKGQEPRKMRPGDWVYVPRGTVHRNQNLSGAMARSIELNITDKDAPQTEVVK